jgi:hypothetical protein
MHSEEVSIRLRTRSGSRKGSIHADKTSICTITARSAHWANAEINRQESPKNRMDAGDFAAACGRLHTFRITRLCMSCTRLMNKHLQTHVFR